MDSSSRLLSSSLSSLLVDSSWILSSLSSVSINLCVQFISSGTTSWDQLEFSISLVYWSSSCGSTANTLLTREHHNTKRSVSFFMSIFVIKFREYSYFRMKSRVFTLYLFCESSGCISYDLTQRRMYKNHIIYHKVYCVFSRNQDNHHVNNIRCLFS